jgi:hypothetical protein
MTKTLFAFALISILVCLAAAQDNHVAPPLTARDNPQPASAQTTPRQANASSTTLPFCPPKTCLYYAGDFDSTDSNADGLFNANYTTDDVEGETWVGVKPPKAVMVTGATFNELFTSGFIGSNPTPFQTAVNLSNLAGGTIVCKTTGNAILKQYGESDFGYVQYSYTVKKLAQACKIAKPSKQYPSTYVNLLPTSNNGYGYVVNVEDAKPNNHRGWKNDLDDCYFFCGGGCGNWIACQQQGSFDELSIALTGKQPK